ncbi:MAG: class I SAM-dependent DNA methyltransferase [Bdellovibrionales bacterium]|nr:class I SAM-dependent DNA methyltransferase [Bdellovibrionales bacterium]
MSHNEIVSFIWQVAELLRGPYRPNQYKKVMLPLIVLRRLDCVLEPTKEKVLAKIKSLKGSKVKNIEPILNRVAGQKFHNKSKFTFKRLKADPDNISANLTNFMKGFSERARKIIEHFKFEKEIAELEKHNRLYKVISKFCEVDLHPDKVRNIQMGYIFEELIRRFNEASNEEAGDHFTPREVIRLMVNLIFLPDNDILIQKGIIKTLFDPACGTGGMLSVSSDFVRELNPQAQLEVFGQDYNSEAYAVCGSDMMIKGQDIEHIQFGNSFTADQFSQKTFGYMLANPPFGVEWKPEEDVVKKEHSEQGFGGRFGAGLPRISDGSLLFLQHMISKIKGLKEGGTRLAIVFNGSPLFTGGAGSGESEIRKWIIENDWLEAIVALPDQLFYNTGIHTYIWILTNRKEKHRKKKIQLINAVSFFEKMRKSLGKKRHQITEEQKDTITKLYGDFKEGEFVRIFDSEDFGYHRITVERPLRLNFQVNDERLSKLKESKAFLNLAISKKRKKTKEAEEEVKKGKKLQENILVVLSKLKSKNIIKNREKIIRFLKEEFKEANLQISPSLFKAILQSLSERDETADICKNSKGKPEPDSELRDYENVPLKEDITAYMEKEVLPHVPDAWVDKSKTKVGYEINFNRYFYKYNPPRSLSEIETDLQKIEKEIAGMLSQMVS